MKEEPYNNRVVHTSDEYTLRTLPSQVTRVNLQFDLFSLRCQTFSGMAHPGFAEITYCTHKAHAYSNISVSSGKYIQTHPIAICPQEIWCMCMSNAELNWEKTRIRKVTLYMRKQRITQLNSPLLWASMQTSYKWSPLWGEIFWSGEGPYNQLLHNANSTHLLHFSQDAVLHSHYPCTLCDHILHTLQSSVMTDRSSRTLDSAVWNRCFKSNTHGPGSYSINRNRAMQFVHVFKIHSISILNQESNEYKVRE